MAADSSERQLPARPDSRLAAATVASCCLVLLTMSPAAGARSTHHARGKHAIPGTAQSTTAPEAEQAPAEPEAGASEETRGQQEPPSQQEPPAQQGPPAQQEAETSQGAANQPQAARGRHKGTREPGHRKEGAKEPGGHREEGGEKERPGETPKRGREDKPTTPAGGDPAGATTPIAAPVAQPAASIASTGAVAATASTTTSATTAAPVVADTFAQASVDHRRHTPRSATGARRGKARRAAARDRALAAGPAAQLGALPVSRSAKSPGGDRKERAGTAARAASPSPLTTTITRIVDVVPTPVRMLIAALLAVALAFAARSRIVALRARRLERQRVELLEDVGLLQAALLPVPPDRLGPVGTSVAYKPAAGPGAGGDFYDVFALEDGQLAVIVGDVSGHGRQALPHTALVRFTLRAYLEAGLSPREAVQKAGTVLERQLGEQFATVLAATYNPRERVLVYSCAGHPPPLVLGMHGSGSLQPVTACSAPPIGVGVRTGTRQTVVSVPGSAQICFYTDGVTEARVGRDLFGAERLLATLCELGEQATASSVLESVVARTDSRADDMAACLLRVQGDDGGPAMLAEELELDRRQLESERAERFLLACGVRAHETAEMLHAARAALARADTVVLELQLTDGPPLLSLRRDHLSYLHAQHENVEVYR